MIGKFSTQSPLVRHVLTLFTGSTIAQAIPVLVSPLLTRMYPVSDFATLTVVTTLISLVGVIVAGRYEVGIGLPADDREAKQMVWLTAFITIGVSLITFLVMLFARQELAGWLNIPGSADYLLFVPLATLLYGFYQGVSYWGIRKRYYQDLSIARVGQSLVNSGVSLGFAFTGLGLNGLVFGNVSGHLAALGLTLMRILPRNDFTRSSEYVTASELKSLAGKYADLPRVNGVHALTDMGQASLVIFIISAYFGSIATGLYGLTMRILQAPMTMIGTSFSYVFYKEVSEKIAKKEKILKLFHSTVKTLALISLPVFLVIVIAGPDLFGFVFGDEWRDAGTYARIMSPWLFLNFIASPVSHIPLVLNRQRQFFVYSLIGNLSVVLSLIAGAVFFNEIKETLILVTATHAIFQTSMILYFRKLAKVADAAAKN